MKHPAFVHIFLGMKIFLLKIDHACAKNPTLSDGGSFNGRTTDSDSVNVGSNPALPAKQNQGVAKLSRGPFFFDIKFANPKILFLSYYR